MVNDLSAPVPRPAWLEKAPDVELDIRRTAENDSFFLAIMEGLDRLAPGRVMGIRTDFEPTLLYPIMYEKGCEYWPERDENGDWNVRIRRRPQA